MAELAKIATRLIGASLYIKIKKVLEGNFNKTFLLIINDRNEVIIKVLNPNIRYPYFTTASKVVIIDFIYNSSLLYLTTVANKIFVVKKYSKNTGS